MRNFVIASVSLFIIISACKRDEKQDYNAMLIGQWINTHVDNADIETDSTFVFEFKSNFIETVYYGHTIDTNNSLWVSDTSFTYSVIDNMILIQGNSLFGSYLDIEFEIISIDQNELIYSISKYEIDGVNYADSKIYTNKKIETNLRNTLIGTWYGKSTNPGNPDTNYHYWDYFDDGTYDYYYQNEMGNWINKPDNLGSYFLYGELLATNFSNDLVSGGTGSAYECWNININDSHMSWTGIRQNGLITSYEMEKVDGPPPVLFQNQ